MGARHRSAGDVFSCSLDPPPIVLENGEHNPQFW
jgi:hypothetical protein